MITKKAILWILFVSLFHFNTVLGQQIERSIICITGNYVESGGLKVSHTFGEPIATTFNGPDITTYVVQGFEQPFGSLITGSYTDLNYELQVYPNPTMDFVYLSSEDLIEAEIKVELLSISGQFIQDQPLQQFTKIDMTTLAAGSYFLRLVDIQNTPIQNIIIQKLN